MTAPKPLQKYVEEVLARHPRAGLAFLLHEVRTAVARDMPTAHVRLTDVYDIVQRIRP